MQKQFAIAVVVGWVLVSTSLVTAGETHSWNGIAYPDLKCNFGNGTTSPSIRVAGQKGLQFYLSFSWLSSSWPGSEGTNKDFSFPDIDNIKVRLHYSDGSIAKPIEPEWGDPRPLVMTSHGYHWVHFDYIFPWGKNKMHEGWLEVVFPKRIYWLEIPYGFTRDPNSTCLPTAKTGRPKLPKALAKVSKNTKFVNWKHVSYDLGKIQNGWRLSLYHSNPFDAHSEIILYREDSKVGKSSFLWNLHSPRTKISIKQSNGDVLTSRVMSLRLHNDGMRRSDKFDFYCNPSNDSLRDWGTMIIEIDDKKWTTIMPSSLFRYVHGVADPYNEATLSIVDCQKE